MGSKFTGPMQAMVHIDQVGVNDANCQLMKQFCSNKLLYHSLFPLIVRSWCVFPFILQYYYPESLSKLIIVNAPWVFRMLWAIVSPWIHPLTRERVSE